MLKFQKTPEGVRWLIFNGIDDEGPRWEASRHFPNREMAIQDVLMLHAQLQILLATSLSSSNQRIAKKEKDDQAT